MKDYAKVGNRRGRPAYRTPSRFIYKKAMEVKRAVLRHWDLAARLDKRKVREKKIKSTRSK